LAHLTVKGPQATGLAYRAERRYFRSPPLAVPLDHDPYQAARLPYGDIAGRVFDDQGWHD
jgi:hypothetical protein